MTASPLRLVSSTFSTRLSNSSLTHITPSVSSLSLTSCPSLRKLRPRCASPSRLFLCVYQLSASLGTVTTSFACSTAIVHQGLLTPLKLVASSPSWRNSGCFGWCSHGPKWPISSNTLIVRTMLSPTSWRHQAWSKALAFTSVTTGVADRLAMSVPTLMGAFARLWLRQVGQSRLAVTTPLMMKNPCGAKSPESHTGLIQITICQMVEAVRFSLSLLPALRRSLQQLNLRSQAKSLSTTTAWCVRPPPSNEKSGGG